MTSLIVLIVFICFLASCKKEEKAAESEQKNPPPGVTGLQKIDKPIKELKQQAEQQKQTATETSPHSDETSPHNAQQTEDEATQEQHEVSVHEKTATSKEFSIIVPDEVKNAWEGVVLTVTNREKNASEDVKANLDSEIVLPNTNLKIVVGQFLPHFQMKDKMREITSTSNNLENPAVNVRIYEGDAQIYPDQNKKWGWFYAKYPHIHPFEHEKYQIVLKEGIPKK
jgi:hypothetical protein